MKLLATLTLALPLASAAAVRIRDPVVVDQVQERMWSAVRKVQAGDYVPVPHPGNNETDIEGRAISVIAGLALVATGNLAHSVLVDIGKALGEHFFKPGHVEIWKNQDYCRTYFETQGGGNCEIRTYEKGAGSASATHNPDDGCSWPGAPDGGPAIQAFVDPGVGAYGMAFMATDKYTVEDDWGDYPVSTCEMEGLCNPLYVFLRDEYEIVLYSWAQQGTISECQYSGGNDCGGICSSGVKDQFGNGGMRWGGDCAIPCSGDAGLPDSLRRF